MKRLSLVLTAIALSACSLTGNGNQSASSSASSLPETTNVSYTGTVEALGPSVYMQGTHQLKQEDGKTVLLESTLLRLNDYIGSEVTVYGSVRPTVEQGGIIMRVDAITILSESSSSSMDSSSSETSSSVSSSSVAAVSSSRSSVSSSPAVVSSSAKSSIAPVAQSSSVAAGTSADLNARASAMASADLAAARWTQQYCTSHIGFCVPIHKNWWYTSFGTSGSALWHVEVSNKEISGLGDGVIVVNLMSGAGQADGTVTASGDFVTAYKAWKDNTHFEISAPASLRAAVTYMMQNLTEYQVAQ